MNYCDYTILFLLTTAFGSLLFWLGPYDRWVAKKLREQHRRESQAWFKSFNETREWHVARSLQENDHESEK